MREDTDERVHGHLERRLHKADQEASWSGHVIGEPDTQHRVGGKHDAADDHRPLLTDLLDHWSLSSSFFVASLTTRELNNKLNHERLKLMLIN